MQNAADMGPYSYRKNFASVRSMTVSGPFVSLTAAAIEPDETDGLLVPRITWKL